MIQHLNIRMHFLLKSSQCMHTACRYILNRVFSIRAHACIYDTFVFVVLVYVCVGASMCMCVRVRVRVCVHTCAIPTAWYDTKTFFYTNKHRSLWCAS